MLPVFLLETEEDKRSFERLYYQYRQLMYNRAYDILKDRHLAEDAVQEAFVRITNNFHKIQDDSYYKTKGFVTVIVENISKTYYTKRKKVPMVSFEEIKDTISDNTQNLEQLLSELSIGILAAEIGALSSQDKEILILRYVYEFSNKELACILNIKGTAVRKRLERAKKRLAALLERNKYNG